jgi:hypothetical protein
MMDSPLPEIAGETADSQLTTDGPMGLAAVPCSGRVGAEIGTDDAWPANLMCRLLLPVPVKELAAIGDALAKIARKQGKEARMKQVGQTLEIFTVQNASGQAITRKETPDIQTDEK